MTQNGSVFEIRKVAIIGAGAAGRSFAGACVRAGFRVLLEDVMPSKLRCAEAEVAILGSGGLELALTVEDAVRDADLAVDFVPDELESKLEIFSMLDRMAPPRTILCTPTEALSITDLASCVYRPDRCLAVRGGMDSQAVNLVFPADQREEVATAVAVFLRRLGRVVTVSQDSDGPMLTKNLSRTVAG